jgi:lysophospholipid acyltransferase (LPLAT)-like uncharacterized protein
MQKIIFKIITSIVYLLLIFIGKTSSVKLLNYDIVLKFKKKKQPVIYSFWHNRLLYLAYLYRKKRVGVMVSLHRDGEYISEIMRKLKLVPIRGSTTRGGIKALIEIIKYTKNSGYDSAFTPDGPRGPKYEIQDGILLASKKSKAPILPITWNAKYKIVLNTWDNFIIPLPFNKFIVLYGNPIWVNENDDLNIKKIELKSEMMRILKIVENYF